MSGEPNEDNASAAADAAEDGDETSGVIKVEVEAPTEAATADPAGAGAEPAEASQDDPAGDAADPPAKGAAKLEEPVDPLAAAQARIEVLLKDKKDTWERFVRSAADLENLRKRHRRELDDARLDAKWKVLKEMLPVVDNLERAIEHVNQSSTEETDERIKPFVEGVQLVLRQFVTAFERLDVTAIDAQGKPFDPNLHEAISQQESDAPPGSVVQVLQRGYRSGERLLRPALVVVAKAKPAE